MRLFLLPSRCARVSCGLTAPASRALQNLREERKETATKAMNIRCEVSVFLAEKLHSAFFKNNNVLHTFF